MTVVHTLRQWLFCLTVTALALAGCSRSPPATPVAAEGTGNDQFQVIQIRGPTDDQQEKAEETVAESFKTGARPKVVVELFNGPIRVAAGGAVKASVTKRAYAKTEAEAKEKLKLLTVSFAQDGDTVRVTAPRPEDNNLRAELSATLEVPADATLDLKTASGAVDVAGIRGDIVAETTAAAVKVQDARGVLQLRTTFDRIEVTGPSPKVTARNANGSIVVRGAAGTLDLTSSSGSIQVDGQNTDVKAHTTAAAVTVKGATGKVNVQTTFDRIDVDAPCQELTAVNANGSIKVRTARGPVNLSSNSGAIDVDAPCAKVTARTTAAPVAVKGATGPVEVQTTFDRIEVDAPCASVTAANANGSIKVRTTKGPLQLTSRSGGIDVDAPSAKVTAKTTAGPIKVRGATGTLDLSTTFDRLDIAAADAAVTATNANGSIAFTGSLARGKHRFETRSGGVTLTLPADARFRLDARTSFGRVRSDFVLRETTKASDTQLSGTVGDNPDVDISVSASAADVLIQRAK